MKYLLRRAAAIFTSVTMAAGLISAVPQEKAFAASSGLQDMYRLYNPNSGEHFYTADIDERGGLIDLGWRYEGIGWVAPQSSNTPVYRLYNINSGDHYYTIDPSEKDGLVRMGWKYEKIGWYSDDSRKVPLYQQYNPNARTGTHNYTADKSENDGLSRQGWRAEGVAWYAISGKKDDNSYNPTKAELLNAIKLGSSGELVGEPCYADFDNDGRLEVVQASWKSTGEGIDLNFWYSDGISVEGFGRLILNSASFNKVESFVIPLKDGSKHYACNIGWRPSALGGYLVSSDVFSIKKGDMKNLFSMVHGEIQSVATESIKILYGREKQGELMEASFGGKATIYYDGTRYPIPSDSVDYYMHQAGYDTRDR